MARVAGINIPDRKQAWISLTHIYGIGRTTALEICAASGIKHDTKIEALETEKNKLKDELKICENEFLRKKKLAEDEINKISQEKEMIEKTINVIKNLKSF